MCRERQVFETRLSPVFARFEGLERDVGVLAGAAFLGGVLLGVLLLFLMAFVLLGVGISGSWQLGAVIWGNLSTTYVDSDSIPICISIDLVV